MYKLPVSMGSSSTAATTGMRPGPGGGRMAHDEKRRREVVRQRFRQRHQGAHAAGGSAHGDHRYRYISNLG